MFSQGHVFSLELRHQLGIRYWSVDLDIPQDPLSWNLHLHQMQPLDRKMVYN